VTRGSLAVLVAALAVALAVVPVASARPQRAQAGLTIYAAASLDRILPQVDPSETYNFAGSDSLQAQIGLGAPADLFLAASATGPDQLFAAGKCRRPVTFIANRLVLVVPASNPAGITSVYDLEKHGVRVVLGTATVPIGAYTRQVLRNLGVLDGITPQVVSQEKDVATISVKLQLGAGDAGFVYRSDAKAAGAGLAVIPVPVWAQPPVRYEGCVVTASPNRAAAAAYLRHLTTARVQAMFRSDGFVLPKKPARIVERSAKRTATTMTRK
jgi:molybdate transport system substrate-binding protein